MLKRGNWSTEDLVRLKCSFGCRPLSQLARELRRTEEAVEQRARQLLGGRRRAGKLSARDEARLRHMVGVAELATMGLVLARHDKEVLKVLRAWARTERRGRFQPWEIRYLKERYASRPDWALSLVLGREASVIRRRAGELCLGKNRKVESVPLPSLEKIVVIQPQAPVRMPRWTDEETEALTLHYSDRPNLEIAQLLGRSIKSVIAKANELGLRKNHARLRDMGRENVRIRHKRLAKRS
ncbi:MAG: hypothetical protein ACE5F1_01775 [Planctomycetota bacterium]